MLCHERLLTGGLLNRTFLPGFAAAKTLATQAVLERRQEAEAVPPAAAEPPAANDPDMKEAAVQSLLGAIERAFASTPGPDAARMDAVTLITEGASCAIGQVLARFWVVGDAAGAGLSAVAGIIINHVTEALAKRELRAWLETLLRSDRRLSQAWIPEVYRIDLIDDDCSLWLERVPDHRILDFRLPFAPEHHRAREWEAAFGTAFGRVRARRGAKARITTLALFAWREERGMRVNDDQELKRLLFGQPVHTGMVAPLRFPLAALRPRRGGGPDDVAIVGLFPPFTDAPRRQPEGILVIHERTAATFLYRLEDGLYRDPP